MFSITGFLTRCLSCDSLERTRFGILRQRDGEALIRTVKKICSKLEN